MDLALKAQFERALTGANVHTVNKARFYQDFLQDKGRTESLGRLEELMRQALSTGDYRPLKEHMSRWW